MVRCQFARGGACSGFHHERWSRKDEVAGQPVLSSLGLSGHLAVCSSSPSQVKKLAWSTRPTMRAGCSRMMSASSWGDVAVRAAYLRERVADEDRAPSGQAEGCAGEGVVLQVLHLFEPRPCDELVGGMHLNAEVFGNGRRANWLGRAQAHVGANADRLPLSLGLRLGRTAVATIIALGRHRLIAPIRSRDGDARRP